MTTNTEKTFCETGKHVYIETDILKSLGPDETMYILVQCGKCDSSFVKGLKPLL